MVKSRSARACGSCTRARVCPYILGRTRARARARTRSGALAVAKNFGGCRRCDLAQTRWFVSSSPSGSGRGSKLSCARNAERGGQATMIAASSKRCCGGAAPACRGAISLRSSARGRRSSTALIAGPRAGSGSACSWRCRRTATTSGTASTAPSTVHISMPPGAKGGRGPWHRSIARRTLDEGPPRCRCAWLAAAL
jgi:hypothetical protein